VILPVLWESSSAVKRITTLILFSAKVRARAWVPCVHGAPFVTCPLETVKNSSVLLFVSFIRELHMSCRFQSNLDYHHSHVTNKHLPLAFLTGGSKHHQYPCTFEFQWKLCTCTHQLVWDLPMNPISTPVSPACALGVSPNPDRTTISLCSRHWTQLSSPEFPCIWTA